MRVIAGKFRSRVLTAPAGTETRPTSDRLRETVFNILAARFGGGLNGLRVADLYAGTGAVGIEALSRGAVHCWFGETGSAALKSLKTNLTTLKIAPGEATVETGGAKAVLGKMGAVDFIYLDPPYEAEAEYERSLGALGRSELLAAGGVVAVEFATRGKFKLAERYGTLAQGRVLKQGDSSVAFYERAAQVVDSMA